MAVCGTQSAIELPSCCLRSWFSVHEHIFNGVLLILLFLNSRGSQNLLCYLSRFSSVGRASGSQIFWEHEFESWQPHLCYSMWGQDRLRASCQEVECSTRGGSQETYITFTSAMRIRQPTLALKPRGDVTRNPKQGYQWPQKWTCVRQKLLKKK